MARNGRRKPLAVDTNLLLDLARELDAAHEMREVFQAAGYTLLAGPTVFEELGFAALHGKEADRVLAQRAVANAAGWGIKPFDLSDAERTIAERFAGRLLEYGLLPQDEFNDALILAETAVSGVPLLVTSDRHLLDVDADALLNPTALAAVTSFSMWRPPHLGQTGSTWALIERTNISKGS